MLPPCPVLSHLVWLAAPAPPSWPRGPNPMLLCAPPALWLVPSCQQSAICLLLAEGPEFMSHLPRWREAWEQPPPGFTAQRARPELGSPASPVQSHSGNAWGVALLPHCGPGVTSVRAESEKQAVWAFGLGLGDSWLYCERLWASVFSCVKRASYPRERLACGNSMVFNV